jgi:hypothetical protein
MAFGNDPILMGGHQVPRDKYNQNKEGKITLSLPEIQVSNKEQAQPVETQPKSADLSSMPAQSVEQATGYNPYSETARSAIGQGLGMGFGDELEAALRTGSITNDEYLQLRNELRKKHELFATEHPAINFGSELAGGIAFPYGGALKGVGMLGKTGANISKSIQTALESPKAWERIKGGSALAAPFGGIVGAGTAENMGDIPSNVLAGGLTAGLIGGVGVETVKAGWKIGSSVFKNITERLGLGNVNKTATKIISNKLQQDELTAADVEDYFKEARRLGVSDAILADLGTNLRSFGQTVQSQAGKGRTQIEDFLTQRTQNVPNEIVTGLVSKAKVKQTEFGYDYKTMLTNRQKELANKAYPNAYSIDVPAEPFRTYANRKDFIAAYQEAVDSAERKGEALLPPLSELQNADFVPTELLHKIKIGLDKVIAQEKDAFGRLSKKGAELNQVKKEFNNKIKELNPEYAASNAKFADEARIQEAFDLGSTYNKLDADELALKIKNLNKDEKEAFRVGLLSNAKKQLSEFKGGNFVNKIFSSDKQKAAMRNVFDTPKDYQDFVKQLQYSADKLKTTQKVLGGSQTQERMGLAQEDVMAMDIVQNPSIAGVISTIIKSIKTGAQMSPRTLEAVKQKLFTANPQEQQIIINEIKKLNDPNLQKSLLNAPFKTPAVAGTFSLLD